MDETLKITLSLWGWDWNSLMSSQSPIIFSKLKVVFCLCNAKRSIHKTTLLSLYVFAIKNPGTRLTDKSRKRSNFGLNQVIYLCFAIKNKLKVSTSETGHLKQKNQTSKHDWVVDSWFSFLFPFAVKYKQVHLNLDFLSQLKPCSNSVLSFVQ